MEKLTAASKANRIHDDGVKLNSSVTLVPRRCVWTCCLKSQSLKNLFAVVMAQLREDIYSFSQTPSKTRGISAGLSLEGDVHLFWQRHITLI
jgi:hypothetical protein